MSSYIHLTPFEREQILLFHEPHYSLAKIARILGRDESTISWEIRRISGSYLAIKAQKDYEKKRKKSRRQRLLEHSDMRTLIMRLIVDKNGLLNKSAVVSNARSIFKLVTLQSTEKLNNTIWVGLSRPRSPDLHGIYVTVVKQDTIVVM